MVMVEEQSSGLTRRVGRLEDHVIRLAERIAGVEKRMDGLEKRMDSLEDQMRTGFRDLHTEVRWLSFGLAVLIGAVGVWG